MNDFYNFGTFLSENTINSSFIEFVSVSAFKQKKFIPLRQKLTNLRMIVGGETLVCGLTLESLELARLEVIYL